MFFKEKTFIPLEVCWLLFDEKISDKIYTSYRKKLMDIISYNINVVKVLNTNYFKDRLIAKEALRCNWTMQYMPMYQNDDEMVKFAIENGCAAIQYIDEHYLEDREFILFAIEHSKVGTIMSYEQMERWKKDKELALRACSVEPNNFSFIAESLQDDYQIAEIAIKNSDKNHSVVFYSLSERLKNNKRLALLECENEIPDTESFSDELKDDDDIAEKIIRLHGKDSWSLYWMSNRIREKYGLSNT